MSNRQDIGIAHLTLLSVAPPDLVAVASQAGYDTVGIRVGTVTPTEERWPMEVGSALFAETVTVLEDTGVRVNDVEIVRLSPDFDVADHIRTFESGQALGARFLNVLADDPDLIRVHDNFAALDTAASRYGLRPILEPMVFMSVSDFDDAVAVVKGTGGGVMVDPLHLRRFGGSVAEIAGIDPALLPYCQICDAPAELPASLHRPASLPRGQSPDVDNLQLESRAVRLLPGEGELPLAEIFAAMPPDIPISLEAPNIALLEQLGAVDFCRRARGAIARVLDEAAAIRSAGDEQAYDGAAQPGRAGHGREAQ